MQHLTQSMVRYNQLRAAGLAIGSAAGGDGAAGATGAAGAAGAEGGLTVQSLVLTVTGFARAERMELQLFDAVVESILASDVREWTGQSCSNLLNGLARLLELQLAPRELVHEVRCACVFALGAHACHARTRVRVRVRVRPHVRVRVRT